MSDKVKTRRMIAGAAFCAALFLFSGAMLAREYLDQKQSAEAFEEVAELIKEDVELPALELENAPATEEVTAFEKYADVYAKNSDLVGWVSIPGTRIDYPVMQTKDSPDFYREHKTICFDTLDSFGEYEVIAAFKTVAYSGEGFKYYHFVNAESAEAFDEYIAECKALALYDTGVTAEYGDKLITLSTCEYSRTNGRMVVVAKLLDA